MNWRNTVAANKSGLKDLLKESITQNSDLANSISGKFDRILDALLNRLAAPTPPTSPPPAKREPV
ncbi:hypothetical protein AWH04_09010 [Rhodococcus erythropolis]|nr:hypothetical protein AWH04_09010 [Rhodococcus erythropolis]